MIMLSQVADGKNISTREKGRSERGGQGRGKGEEIWAWQGEVLAWGRGVRGFLTGEEQAAGGKAGETKWDLMNGGRQGASLRK